MRSARFPALTLAIVALAFGGCGDDDDDGGGGGGAESAAPSGGGGGGSQTVKLSETDFKITPASPKVKAGEVTFAVTNDGQAPHALEVEGPGGEEETDTINAGESADLTVDLSEPGTYVMYCPIGNHRQQGMEGEITVGGGGSASSGSGEKSEDDSGGGSGGY